MALKSFVIPPEADGMKAESFLRRIMPALPESTLRRIFSARDIRLDGVRISRETVLHAGGTLKVFLPDAAGGTDLLRIVYEDEDVLLVNKPAGLSVEADVPGTVSLSELCRLHITEKDPDAYAPVPCHRLDVKTCGLCLFAKNRDALAVLQDVFRNRAVEKYYTCLVRGIMKPPSAVCRAYLLKDARNARVRILSQEAAGARSIVTGYETLAMGPVSRLRVHLITGRTHQIRAHLAALGHPLLGDDLYGDHAFNRAHKARSLKLCATSLVLSTGGRLPRLDGKVFEIEPPF